MNWYYMAGGSSGERKGPIPHHHFVAMVQQGRIPPASLASSPELTGGKWLPVQDVPILRKALENTAVPRSGAPEEPQRRPPEPPPPRAAIPTSPPSDTHTPSEDGRPIVHVKSPRSSSVRTVFDHYWLPSYIQALWYATLALSAIGFVGTVLLTLAVALKADLEAETIFSIGVSLFFVAGWLAGWVVAVRLILEMYAIFFDIRSYVKRQTELMERSAAE